MKLLIAGHRRAVSAAVLLIAAASLAPAWAERTPTQAEVEKARAEHPLPSPEQLDAVRGKNRQDTERALREAQKGGANTPINITPGAGIDIGALVEKYRQNKHAFDPEAAQGRRNEQQGLLLFVSLSMPAASLDRAIDQAAQAGAALVGRGLIKPGDLNGTAEQMGKLLKNRNVSFLIDPTLFQKFDIRQIPALVLLPGKTLPRCENSACNTPTPPHWAIGGDVSLDYALEAIGRAAPEARATVEPYLARLRRGGFYDRR